MKPFLRPGVVFSETARGCDVLDLIDLRHFEMSPSALPVLRACNGKNTVEGIVAAVRERSSPDLERLAVSVREFMGDLVQNDLVLPYKPEQISGMPDAQPPGVVFCEMTRTCNLSCVWCYNNSRAPMKREMSADDWKRCIDRFSANKCTFLFTGGEPLSRKDLIDIASHAKQAGHDTQLFTNGTLIGPHNADSIAECFDYVRITIDGATAATNDVVRGTGSFDKALRGMKLLISRGGRVCWQCIVSQHNIHELRAILDRAIDAGAAGFRMASVDPLGRGCGTPQLELTHAQEFVFWRFLSWAMEEFKSKIQIDWGADYCLEDAWQNIMSVEPGTAPSCTPVGRRDPANYMRFARTSQCGVGIRSFLINPEGSIGLCPLLTPPAITLGNVFENDPLDVWYNHPVFSIFRDETLEDWDDCSTCGFRYRCLGGCRGRAFQFLNSLHRCDEKMLKYFVVPQ